MSDRALIIAEARRWIGTPYMHAQSTRGAGCDCLGLVRGVWRALFGGEPESVPAYAATWRDGSGEETLLAAADRHLVRIYIQPPRAAPGHVLVFRWRPGLPARHCAILIATDRIVHAYEAAGSVVESPFASAWRARLAAAYSFPGAR